VRAFVPCDEVELSPIYRRHIIMPPHSTAGAVALEQEDFRAMFAL